MFSGGGTTPRYRTARIPPGLQCSVGACTDTAFPAHPFLQGGGAMRCAPLRARLAPSQRTPPVDDPTEAYRELTRICEPVVKGTMRVRGLNPLRDDDRSLFEAVIRA